MKTSSTERFLFLDALRGVAACGVVLNHSVFANQFSPTLENSLPSLSLVIAHLSVAGVWIFFVLSGFIIAHSLRNDALTTSSIWRFILRRHARLDSPYWAALILMILVGVIDRNFFNHTENAFPSLKIIILNMLYLQNIFKVDQILVVGWTLCIEIQFYLFFILILYVSKLIFSDNAYNFKKNSGCLLFFTGTISVASWAIPLKSIIWSHALFASYWDFFAAGVLAYWSYSRFIDRRLFLIYFIIFTSATVARLMVTGDWSAYSPQITADLTMLAFYLAGVNDKMGCWFNFSLLRNLGGLSYSLYLVHLPIFTLLFGIGGSIHLNASTTVIFWLISLPLTVFISHLWWKFIEIPSLKLSDSFRGKGQAVKTDS